MRQEITELVNKTMLSRKRKDELIEDLLILYNLKINYMDAKQKEQLGFIEAANDLNQEIYEKHGETEDKFYYSTDGHVDVFGFSDTMLWNSEMDDREFIEDKNDYEDFKPYITKVFNNYVEKMHKLSL